MHEHVDLVSFVLQDFFVNVKLVSHKTITFAFITGMEPQKKMTGSYFCHLSFFGLSSFQSRI